MNRDGETARSGGFGYLLGDEGGGYWIAREAVSTALRSTDGRAEAGGLPEIVREEFGIADVRDLIPSLQAGDLSPARVAELAPRILTLSDSDPVAAVIVSRAGFHLAELLEATARKLKLERPHVALWGGLWKSSHQPMQKALNSVLSARSLTFKIVEHAQPPEWGAIRCLQKITLQASE